MTKIELFHPESIPNHPNNNKGNENYGEFYILCGFVFSILRLKMPVLSGKITNKNVFLET